MSLRLRTPVWMPGARDLEEEAAESLRLTLNSALLPLCLKHTALKPELDQRNLIPLPMGHMEARNPLQVEALHYALTRAALLYARSAVGQI